MRMRMKKEQADRRRQTLEFMDSMLGTLRVMASKERYDFLALLIEMAELECKDQLKCGSRAPPDAGEGPEAVA